MLAGRIDRSAIAAVGTTIDHDFVLFLVVITTIESMLGGGGRLVAIGPISLRMMVFGFYCMTFLLMALILPSRIQPLSWLVCITISVFVGFFSFIGVLHHAGLTAAVMDANSFFSLAYIVLLFAFFTIRTDGTQFFLNLFVKCALMIALFTILMYLLAVIGAVNLRKLDALFRAFAYGGNTGMMKGKIPRIYFISQIYLQVAFGIVLSRLLFAGERERQRRLTLGIQAMILLFAALLSFTRGYWLGIVVTFMILMLLSRFTQRLKVILSGALIFIALLSFVAAAGVYDFGVLKERFVSSFQLGSVREDHGDYVRLLEVIQVSSQFRQSPLLGVGFGVPMPSSYYIIRERITGKTLEGTEVVIELSYLDLLRKAGLVGFMLFIISLFILYRKIRTVLSSGKSTPDYPAVAGYFAGFGGFLITAGTNPYLLSSSGIFLFTIAIALVLALKDLDSGMNYATLRAQNR